MLSDPQKREVFDRYGEEGLKGGAGPGTPGAGGGPSGVPPGGFHFRTAEDIFAEVRGLNRDVGS